VLTGLLRVYQPEVLLLAATALGRDLAPRIAVRLDTSIVSQCTAFRFNDEGLLEMKRPTYGGRVWATYLSPSARPIIATVRPGVLGISPPKKGRPVTVENVEVQLQPDTIRTKVLESHSVDKESLDVSEADVVVAVGRGMKDAGLLPQVKELAGLLKASYGGSRAAVDEGWIPFGRQIGQTGKTVAPRLILCLGISGAPQFTLGMRDAGCIVAVNNDREAPIFKVADIAVLGDLREILPTLIGHLKGQVQGCTVRTHKEEQNRHEP
jgi:electron transfer flavoprotein alpha subunit